MRDIKDLVVLVTGGGSGLGEATARRLVRDGAGVVICDIPSSKGISVADQLGEKCIFVPTDVTSEADVQNALQVVKSRFHKLDAVVNCAGINVLKKVYDFETDTPHPLEDFQKVLLINTVGTFNVIRLAVGLMAKNQPDEDGQKGVIINTTSICALHGQERQVAYGASKAAVIGMTQPLVSELHKQGIRCCTIAPGVFDTPIFHGLPEEFITSLDNAPPLPKRMGHPDEYADVVQTLIRNSYMNGCEIKIDGALTSLKFM